MTKKLVVMGERPGTREPHGAFTSRAGRAFREMMTEAEIDPERVAFSYPKDSGDIAIALCHYDAHFLILSGNRVLQMLQPGLRVGQCHGRVFEYNADTLVLPLFHHEALVRAPTVMRPVVVQELRAFRHVAAHRDEWTKFLPDTCVKCREPKYRITPERVAYCQRHWLRPVGR